MSYDNPALKTCQFESRWVRLTKIQIDSEMLQVRSNLDYELIDEYAEAMRQESQFPNIRVMLDDEDVYWLFSGFHRLEAMKKIGLKSILCDVYQGSKDEAFELALAENIAHGKRRTNADKRRAVMLALKHRPTWSDNRIARQCFVSHPFVAKIREESGIQTNERVGTDGRVQRVGDRKGKNGTTPKPKIKLTENDLQDLQELENIGVWAERVSRSSHCDAEDRKIGRLALKLIDKWTGRIKRWAGDVVTASIKE